MDGLASGATYYAIRDFNVCDTFCSDVSSMCTCTQSTSTVSDSSSQFLVSTSNVVNIASVAVTRVDQTSDAESSPVIATPVLSTVRSTAAVEVTQSPSMIISDLRRVSTSIPAPQASSPAIQHSSSSVVQPTSVRSNAVSMTSDEIPLLTTLAFVPESTSSETSSAVPYQQASSSIEPTTVLSQQATSISSQTSSAVPYQQASSSIEPTTVLLQQATSISSQTSSAVPYQQASSSIEISTVLSQQATSISSETSSVVPHQQASSSIEPTTVLLQQATSISSETSSAVPHQQASSSIEPTTVLLQQATSISSQTSSAVPYQQASSSIEPTTVLSQQATSISSQTSSAVPHQQASSSIEPTTVLLQQATSISSQTSSAVPYQQASSSIEPTTVLSQQATSISSQTSSAVPYQQASSSIEPTTVLLQQATSISSQTSSAVPHQQASSSIEPTTVLLQQATSISSQTSSAVPHQQASSSIEPTTVLLQQATSISSQTSSAVPHQQASSSIEPTTVLLQQATSISSQTSSAVPHQQASSSIEPTTVLLQQATSISSQTSSAVPHQQASSSIEPTTVLLQQATSISSQTSSAVPYQQASSSIEPTTVLSQQATSISSQTSSAVPHQQASSSIEPTTVLLQQATSISSQTSSAVPHQQASSSIEPTTVLLQQATSISSQTSSAVPHQQASSSIEPTTVLLQQATSISSQTSSAVPHQQASSSIEPTTVLLQQATSISSQTSSAVPHQQASSSIEPTTVLLQQATSISSQTSSAVPHQQASSSIEPTTVLLQQATSISSQTSSAVPHQQASSGIEPTTVLLQQATSISSQTSSAVPYQQASSGIEPTTVLSQQATSISSQTSSAVPHQQASSSIEPTTVLLQQATSISSQISSAVPHQQASSSIEPTTVLLQQATSISSQTSSAVPHQQASSSIEPTTVLLQQATSISSQTSSAVSHQQASSSIEPTTVLLQQATSISSQTSSAVSHQQASSSIEPTTVLLQQATSISSQTSSAVPHQQASSSIEPTTVLSQQATSISSQTSSAVPHQQASSSIEPTTVLLQQATSISSQTSSAVPHQQASSSIEPTTVLLQQATSISSGTSSAVPHQQASSSIEPTTVLLQQATSISSQTSSAVSHQQASSSIEPTTVLLQQATSISSQTSSAVSHQQASSSIEPTTVLLQQATSISSQTSSAVPHQQASSSIEPTTVLLQQATSISSGTSSAVPHQQASSSIEPTTVLLQQATSISSQTSSAVPYQQASSSIEPTTVLLQQATSISSQTSSAVSHQQASSSIEPTTVLLQQATSISSQTSSAVSHQQASSSIEPTTVLLQQATSISSQTSSAVPYQQASSRIEPTTVLLQQATSISSQTSSAVPLQQASSSIEPTTVLLQQATSISSQTSSAVPYQQASSSIEISTVLSQQAASTSHAVSLFSQTSSSVIESPTPGQSSTDAVSTHVMVVPSPTMIAQQSTNSDFSRSSIMTVTPEVTTVHSPNVGVTSVSAAVYLSSSAGVIPKSTTPVMTQTITMPSMFSSEISPDTVTSSSIFPTSVVDLEPSTSMSDIIPMQTVAITSLLPLSSGAAVQSTVISSTSSSALLSSHATAGSSLPVTVAPSPSSSQPLIIPTSSRNAASSQAGAITSMPIVSVSSSGVFIEPTTIVPSRSDAVSSHPVAITSLPAVTSIPAVQQTVVTSINSGSDTLSSSYSRSAASSQAGAITSMPIVSVSSSGVFIEPTTIVPSRSDVVSSHPVAITSLPAVTSIPAVQRTVVTSINSGSDTLSSSYSRSAASSQAGAITSMPIVSVSSSGVFIEPTTIVPSRSDVVSSHPVAITSLPAVTSIPAVQQTEVTSINSGSDTLSSSYSRSAASSQAGAITSMPIVSVSSSGVFIEPTTIVPSRSDVVSSHPVAITSLPAVTSIPAVQQTVVTSISSGSDTLSSSYSRSAASSQAGAITSMPIVSVSSSGVFIEPTTIVPSRSDVVSSHPVVITSLPAVTSIPAVQQTVVTSISSGSDTFSSSYSRSAASSQAGAITSVPIVSVSSSGVFIEPTTIVPSRSDVVSSHPVVITSLPAVTSIPAVQQTVVTSISSGSDTFSSSYSRSAASSQTGAITSVPIVSVSSSGVFIEPTTIVPSRSDVVSSHPVVITSLPAVTSIPAVQQTVVTSISSGSDTLSSQSIAITSAVTSIPILQQTLVTSILDAVSSQPVTITSLLVVISMPTTSTTLSSSTSDTMSSQPVAVTSLPVAVLSSTFTVQSQSNTIGASNSPTTTFSVQDASSTVDIMISVSPVLTSSLLSSASLSRTMQTPTVEYTSIVSNSESQSFQVSNNMIPTTPLLTPTPTPTFAVSSGMDSVVFTTLTMVAVSPSPTQLESSIPPMTSDIFAETTAPQPFNSSQIPAFSSSFQLTSSSEVVRVTSSAVVQISPTPTAPMVTFTTEQVSPSALSSSLPRIPSLSPVMTPSESSSIGFTFMSSQAFSPSSEFFIPSSSVIGSTSASAPLQDESTVIVATPTISIEPTRTVYISQPTSVQSTVTQPASSSNVVVIADSSSASMVYGIVSNNMIPTTPLLTPTPTPTFAVSSGMDSVVFTTLTMVAVSPSPTQLESSIPPMTSDIFAETTAPQPFSSSPVPAFSSSFQLTSSSEVVRVTSSAVVQISPTPTAPMVTFTTEQVSPSALSSSLPRIPSLSPVMTPSESSSIGFTFMSSQAFSPSSEFFIPSSSVIGSTSASAPLQDESTVIVATPTISIEPTRTVYISQPTSVQSTVTQPTSSSNVVVIADSSSASMVYGIVSNNMIPTTPLLTPTPTPTFAVSSGMDSVVFTTLTMVAVSPSPTQLESSIPPMTSDIFAETTAPQPFSSSQIPAFSSSFQLTSSSEVVRVTSSAVVQISPTPTAPMVTFTTEQVSPSALSSSLPRIPSLSPVMTPSESSSIGFTFMSSQAFSPSSEFFIPSSSVIGSTSASAPLQDESTVIVATPTISIEPTRTVYISQPTSVQSTVTQPASSSNVVVIADSSSASMVFASPTRSLSQQPGTSMSMFIEPTNTLSVSISSVSTQFIASFSLEVFTPTQTMLGSSMTDDIFSSSVIFQATPSLNTFIITSSTTPDFSPAFTSSEISTVTFSPMTPVITMPTPTLTSPVQSQFSSLPLTSPGSPTPTMSEIIFVPPTTSFVSGSSESFVEMTPSILPSLFISSSMLTPTNPSFTPNLSFSVSIFASTTTTGIMTMTESTISPSVSAISQPFIFPSSTFIPPSTFAPTIIDTFSTAVFPSETLIPTPTQSSAVSTSEIFFMTTGFGPMVTPSLSSFSYQPSTTLETPTISPSGSSLIFETGMFSSFPSLTTEIPSVVPTTVFFTTEVFPSTTPTQSVESSPLITPQPTTDRVSFMISTASIFQPEPTTATSVSFSFQPEPTSSVMSFIVSTQMISQPFSSSTSPIQSTSRLQTFTTSSVVFTPFPSTILFPTSFSYTSSVSESPMSFTRLPPITSEFGRTFTPFMSPSTLVQPTPSFSPEQSSSVMFFITSSIQAPETSAFTRVTPSPTFTQRPSSSSVVVIFSSESPSFLTPSMTAVTSFEPSNSFEVVQSTMSVIEITTTPSRVFTPMFTPTPSSFSVLESSSLLGEVTSTFSSLASSSLEVSFLPVTSSVQPTPEPSSFQQSPTLTPSPSLSSFQTPFLSTSNILFIPTTNIIFSSSASPSSVSPTIESPTSTFVSMSAVPTLLFSSSIIQLPETSSVGVPTIAITPTPSLSLPTVQISSFSSSIILQPETSSLGVPTPSLSPSTMSMGVYSTPVFDNSSSFFMVPSSMFIEPTSTLIPPISTVITRVYTTPVINSSISEFVAEPTSTFVFVPSSNVLSSSFIVPTSIIPSSSFVMATSTLLTSSELMPSPTPPPPPTIPRPSPFAPLTVDIEGLGIPLQPQPTAQDSSDEGLLYEADVGAYIGIRGEDIVGRINVAFGDYSGTSDEYQQEYLGEVEIDVALASDVIWPDDPRIILAIQVRDSLLSTRFPRGETVTVVVSHSIHNETITENSELDPESGVCLVTISLKLHMALPWFSIDEETTVNIVVTVSNANESNNTVATLKPAIVKDTSSNLFMNLPLHSVFSGDIIDIPIYARYKYLLSSFSLKCSVGDQASIVEFTGPKTWSLIQTFPNNDSHHVNGSVTGFRNYDIDNVTSTSADHLTTLSVQIISVETMSIHVECRAVDLLLTTKDIPDINIAANATDRVGLQRGHGLLFTEAISPIKLFVNSSINQVINTAILTNETQMLNLSIQALFNDGSFGPITENVECFSGDNNVINVTDQCQSVYFDGLEGSHGLTTITLQYNDSTLGEIPFRVWLPTDTEIEVGNDTLKKISNFQEDVTIYQKTQVHVVTRLVSSGQSPIDSVYITSVVLPYLLTNNTSILTIDGVNGDINGVGIGVANIRLPTEIVAQKIIFVSDSNPVSVVYLDVFIFSDIQVDLVRGTDTAPPTRVNIQLLQDFSHVSSEVKVVGVAILEDGTRQVLNGSLVTVTPTMSGSLDQISNDHYIIITEIDQIGFDVQWVVNDCPIANGTNSTQINSFTPYSIIATTDSLIIVENTDSAELLGIPHTVKLTIWLVYNDSKMFDVTLHSNINITSSPANQLSINNGMINTITTGENRTIDITVSYENNTLYNQTSITIVKGDMLIVMAHPYPHYDGYRNTTVDSIKRIGMTFQMVEIGVQLKLSNDAVYDVPFNDLLDISTNDNVQLIGDVLSIRNESDLDPVTINVVFGTLSEDLILTIKADIHLEIVSFNELKFIHDSLNQNQYKIQFSVTFEEGIQQYDISSSDYPGLVQFYTDPINATIIKFFQTDLIKVLSNSPNTIDICVGLLVTQDIQVLDLCTTFTANLEAGMGEVDLGDTTGLRPPLEPVVVGTDISVPVYLNLESSPVGIFEMELLYSSNMVEFRGLTQGSDWESGQIVYVDPGIDGDHVTFGGILHTGVQGSQLHLANVSFHSKAPGFANFSANVSFVASNNINTTVLVENTVSEASLISLEITNRSRRDVYYKVEEPPIMSPSQAGYGMRRFERETTGECQPNSVYGDANNDCIVNLRDVFLFQLYVAERVFNFSSPTGKDIYAAVDNGTLEGMFTLSDILELEIITLNLAYEAELNDSNIEYNDTIHKCTFEITGELEALSGQSPPANIEIHLVFGFASTDPSFNDLFRNISFTTPGVKLSDNVSQPYYGGSVKMIVNDPLATTTNFKLNGQADALSIGFNVSVAVIVTDMEENILSFSNGVKDLEEAYSLLRLEGFQPTDNGIMIPSCVAPVIVTSTYIMTSTRSSSIVSPPLSSVTTEVMSTSILSSLVSQTPSMTPAVMTSMGLNSTLSTQSIEIGSTSTSSVFGIKNVPSSTSSAMVSPTSTSSSITDPPSSEDPSTASPASNTAAIVAGVLCTIIAALVVTLMVCGVIVVVRRNKGRQYLFDQTNGGHVRRNSMTSNGSSFWRNTENGIVSKNVSFGIIYYVCLKLQEMSPYHTNIDIVPLEHYGSMMETNIDVVANHCAIMSEDPYGSTSLKPLINNNQSPDRGPPKRGGGPTPLGARLQVNINFLFCHICIMHHLCYLYIHRLEAM